MYGLALLVYSPFSFVMISKHTPPLILPSVLLVATRVAIKFRHEGKLSTVVMLVDSTVVELISVPSPVMLTVYNMSPMSPGSGTHVKVRLTGAPSLAGSTTVELKLARFCD